MGRFGWRLSEREGVCALAPLHSQLHFSLSTKLTAEKSDKINEFIIPDAGVAAESGTGRSPWVKLGTSGTETGRGARVLQKT